MLVVNRSEVLREVLLVGGWADSSTREEFSLRKCVANVTWWRLGKLFSERREFSPREVRTYSSSGCADSDEFGVTKCLYREKHLAVVGNTCNGTVQVRYGWATVLYRLQHVFARSREKWCNIEKDDAKRSKFNLEKNLKKDNNKLKEKFIINEGWKILR